MTHVTDLIDSMGDDAVLITRNDEWLENRRKYTAQQIEQLCNDLHLLMLAQRIKISLQQKNLVPIQHLLRGETGKVENILIRFMNLSDAITIVNQKKDKVDEINNSMQLDTWRKDGYDLEKSGMLR